MRTRGGISSGRTIVVLVALAAMLVPAATDWAAAADRPKTAAVSAKGIGDPYANEVTKRGNMAVVSREFANLVKGNNQLLLSKVAVKARVDKEGQLTAYELVQIDRGSTVSRMGFKPGDLITAVNGIPVKEINAHRESLESSSRFEVELTRKGRHRILAVEIR